MYKMNLANGLVCNHTMVDERETSRRMIVLSENLRVHERPWWRLYLYGSIEAYEMNWHGTCKDLVGTDHMEFVAEWEERT